jgi:hypothetical protein
MAKKEEKENKIRIAKKKNVNRKIIDRSMRKNVSCQNQNGITCVNLTKNK